MEFQSKIKKLMRMKYLTSVLLVWMFLWWGSNAVLKYLSQPLTTDISRRFGDNSRGIQFPLVTICQLDFESSHELMKDCSAGSPSFLQSFIACMKKDKNFKIGPLRGRS